MNDSQYPPRDVVNDKLFLPEPIDSSKQLKISYDAPHLYMLNKGQRGECGGSIAIFNGSDIFLFLVFY